MHLQAGLYDSTARRILIAAWAVLAAIFLTLSAAGCASEAPASGWGGTVDTLSSGQISVHNPRGFVWAAEEGWTLREELRVGTLEGAGPDMFGAITDFEVDRYGRFWVFEGQAQELRVFDADGRFVRIVGRADHVGMRGDLVEHHPRGRGRIAVARRAADVAAGAPVAAVVQRVDRLTGRAERNQRSQRTKKAKRRQHAEAHAWLEKRSKTATQAWPTQHRQA